MTGYNAGFAHNILPSLTTRGRYQSPEARHKLTMANLLQRLRIVQFTEPRDRILRHLGNRPEHNGPGVCRRHHEEMGGRLRRCNKVHHREHGREIEHARSWHQLPLACDVPQEEERELFAVMGPRLGGSRKHFHPRRNHGGAPLALPCRRRGLGAARPELFRFESARLPRHHHRQNHRSRPDMGGRPHQPRARPRRRPGVCKSMIWFVFCMVRRFHLC